jgi:hypothetical protein
MDYSQEPQHIRQGQEDIAATAAATAALPLRRQTSDQDTAFTQDDDQPITAVDRCVSLDVSLHTFDGEGDGRLSMSKQGFRIVLDGRTFGPYHRVYMRPLVGPDGEPLLLPVQCFAPLGR